MFIQFTECISRRHLHVNLTYGANVFCGEWQVQTSFQYFGYFFMNLSCRRWDVDLLVIRQWKVSPGSSRIFRGLHTSNFSCKLHQIFMMTFWNGRAREKRPESENAKKQKPFSINRNVKFMTIMNLVIKCYFRKCLSSSPQNYLESFCEKFINIKQFGEAKISIFDGIYVSWI